MSPALSKARKLILALLLCYTNLALVGSAYAMSEEVELLPEDKAFAFSAELLPENIVEVSWVIADGYYMYRDKMEYEIVGDTKLSRTVSLPAGKVKNDELFGDVEVYTDKFSLSLFIEDASKPFKLLATGQGCNEPVGVCYPPISHEIAFDAGFGGSSVSTASSPRLTDEEFVGQSSLNQPLEIVLASPVKQPEEKTEVESIEQLRELLSLGIEQPEFLEVEDAFKFSVTNIKANTINATFEIADGYYLYQNKLDFISTEGAGITDIRLPDAEIKEDPYFGQQLVYNKSFSVPINLNTRGSEAKSMTLQASYQGCAEQGICYQPVSKIVAFELPSIVAEAAAQSTGPMSPAESGTIEPGGQTTGTSKTLFRLLLGAFFAGILLTFTPCVLPLIPILSGVIAGQGEKLTRIRGGTLALVYVLGTAATYAAMGAIAGATGDQLQSYFQNAWAIGILATIFVLMALSMFGLYELQIPSGIQSRLLSGTNNLSGSIPAVFLLGLVSALIVGACVSPILISFLGIAVSRADPVLGAQMMFSMALGMGVPLIALGFGAGYLMPRAGKWMETVKHVFGVMLIGVAIYLLGVLPIVPVLLLWGVFFIVISSYLGNARASSELSSGWQSLARGTSMVLLVWGIAAIIGGFYGQRDLLSPLPDSLFNVSGPGKTSNQSEETSLLTRVSSLDELDWHFALAKSSNKRIMLDFYADWCIDCLKMEKSTFQNPAVLDTLNSRYIALQVDVTDPNDPGPTAIKKRFGVFGPPAVLFFDSQGKALQQKNFYGYLDPDRFLTLISN